MSIRPFYNDAERFFRAEKKRFDYPSCAPHTTHAWRDYTPWLDTLVTLSHKELETFRSDVESFVISSLISQEFDPRYVVFDPLFSRLLLEGLDLKRHKCEPTGAAF